MIAIHPAPRSILFLRKKNGRIRAAEGEGNGRVWQSCWRASCIFRTACLSTVADSYNKQAFFLTLWYNNIWMNNREICSPRILKHCGAITGALNIRAQHDAAHRFPWLCTPAARPFLHYTSHLAEVNSRSRSTGKQGHKTGLSNSRELHLRHSMAAWNFLNTAWWLRREGDGGAEDRKNVGLRWKNRRKRA